jgi:hypothetical protein
MNLKNDMTITFLSLGDGLIIGGCTMDDDIANVVSEGSLICIVDIFS